MTFLYWYRTCKKPAATNSKNTNDWHSSTQGTLISELFNKTAQQFQNTKIIDQVGHGLVPLSKVEMNSPEMTRIASPYFNNDD
jgi:glutamate racemase